MKQYMRLIGVEILDNEWTELTLVPVSTIKKKTPSLMDLASGGLEQIIASVVANKQYRWKIQVLSSEWKKNTVIIGSLLVFDIDVQKDGVVG